MTDLPETVPEFQQTVDAVGLACPLPILRAKKALATLASGEIFRPFVGKPAMNSWVRSTRSRLSRTT
jgi:TusA-related sulfurtransferase